MPYSKICNSSTPLRLSNVPLQVFPYSLIRTNKRIRNLARNMRVREKMARRIYEEYIWYDKPSF